MLQVVESPRQTVKLLRSHRVLVVAKTLQMAWDLALRLEENGYPAVLLPFRKIATVEQLDPPPTVVVLTSELTTEDMSSVYQFLRRSVRFTKVPIVAVAPAGEAKVNFPVELLIPGSSSTADVFRSMERLLHASETEYGPRAA